MFFFIIKFHSLAYLQEIITHVDISVLIHIHLPFINLTMMATPVSITKKSTKKR